MLIKVFFALVVSIALADCAKLLRKPKVYNALITTDEMLTPSRAFPLIQPVVQPAIPVLTPFYQTNVYDPTYNQSPNDVSDNAHELKNETPIERKSDDPTDINPVNDEESRQQANENFVSQPSNKPESEKSPIPLNEYGFPPSLIPLQKYPVYPYTYPFIYDSYGNIQTVQQFPVLPPNYYPQQEHQLSPIEQPMFQVGFRKLDQEPSRTEKSLPDNINSIPSVSSDAIKNNGNKNTDIPDAEIPPIPFSIKKN